MFSFYHLFVVENVSCTDKTFTVYSVFKKYSEKSNYLIGCFKDYLLRRSKSCVHDRAVKQKLNLKLVFSCQHWEIQRCELVCCSDRIF